MKKLVCISLALFMMIAIMGGCSINNKKYIGEYTQSGNSLSGDIELSGELVLKNNGTGYYETKVVNANNSYDFENGYLVSYYDLTWRVEEEYLIIDYNGKLYVNSSPFAASPNPDGKDHSFSETYELKGNKLFKLGGNSADFTKIG